jgi:hypothetical protein
MNSPQPQPVPHFAHVAMSFGSVVGLRTVDLALRRFARSRQATSVTRPQRAIYSPETCNAIAASSLTARRTRPYDQGSPYLNPFNERGRL